MLLADRIDSNSSLWTKRLKRLHCAPREVHPAGSRGVNKSFRRVFLRHPERSRGILRQYPQLNPTGCWTTLRSARI